MAEVYDIQRSEFERLTRLNQTPARARTLEKARPEYVLVSTWAEFGKLHGHVFIRTRYINEQAFEMAAILEECTYDNVVYGRDTCVDEYEIWHILDEESEQTDDNKVYRNAYGDMVLMTTNEELIDEIWCRHNEDWSLFAGYSTKCGCDYLVIPKRLWDECGQTVEGLLV